MKDLAYPDKDRSSRFSCNSQILSRLQVQVHQVHIFACDFRESVHEALFEIRRQFRSWQSRSDRKVRHSERETIALGRGRFRERSLYGEFVYKSDS